MDQNEKSKSEHENKKSDIKEFDVAINNKSEAKIEDIKNKVSINEQNFFDRKDVHKSKEKKIMSINVAQSIDILDSIEIELSESKQKHREKHKKIEKLENITNDIENDKIEKINIHSYVTNIIEDTLIENKCKNINKTQSLVSNNLGIVNTENVDYSCKPVNNRETGNEALDNFENIKTNNKYDKYKAGSFETENKYVYKSEEINLLHSKDDIGVTKTNTKLDFSNQNIALQLDQSKRSENIEKFDSLNQKLKEKIKISLMKNNTNKLTTDENIPSNNYKKRKIHTLDKNITKNSSYIPEKNSGTENSQKHVKKSKINKNQISHSVFENNISEYFKEINKEMYEYVTKQNEVKVEKDKLNDISNKEKLMSALLDYKDIEIENKKDKYDNRYVKIIESKYDNKYINRFFKRYKINSSDKSETIDEITSMYIKQTEVNNKRKKY